jgi:phosphoribosylanthranilate isomerase
MALRVKICGITRPEQGRAIAIMGAAALGFICVPESPRYVTPEQIRAIVTELPLVPDTLQPICSCIGVFVNSSLDVIEQTVAIGQLTGIQLHGDESPEFCQQVRERCSGVEIIKALRIKSSSALHQAMLYQHWVDTLLLDAYHPSLAGGTGQTLDWASLQQFRPTCSWLLAGGLTPDNVLLALQQVHPDGIDLSSGVEFSPGNKNLEEVARLFAVLGHCGLYTR